MEIFSYVFIKHLGTVMLCQLICVCPVIWTSALLSLDFAQEECSLCSMMTKDLQNSTSREHAITLQLKIRNIGGLKYASVLIGGSGED